MTTMQLSVLEQVDMALDEIQRVRERVMAQPSSVERSIRLAQLDDDEARWWAVLFERSRTRVYWRAALAAHERARQSAWMWRQRATKQETCDAGGVP